MGVLLDSLHSAPALGPVAQDHLLQARQMQALSFTAHIPLVCFGIAFPVMVLLMEWWGQRTGDPLCRTIARRWSRVMIALFAIGAITGTVLSFEMGVLWPNFTATFGGVFGLGFAIEGFSFFLEAIFLGIYVYGWDRLSPRMHLLSGIPIAVTGFLGSWMVISVNAWMNHPSGFRLVAGRVVDVHPWKALFGNDFLWHELIHMYIAAYLVTGFVMAGVYAAARLRGRWTRYERAAIVRAADDRRARRADPDPRRRLGGAHDQQGRADQARRDRGPGQDHRGRAAARPRLVRARAGPVRRAHPEGALRARLPRSQRAGPGAGRGAARRTVRRSTSSASPSRRWSASARCWPILGVLTVVVRVRRRRLPTQRAYYAAVAAAGPLSVVALVAGWVTTEVGRQPWVVYGVMRTSDAVTGAGVIPVSYAVLWALYVAVGAATMWILRRLARMPVETPATAGGPRLR